ncbi:putative F-box/LRR-repeat protein 23 [Tanacetum coccineum]
MDIQDHITPPGHQVHICHRCGWPFPNSHPSSKHRKAHKKACGTIEGYTKLIHSDPLLDDDEEENTPTPDGTMQSVGSHDSFAASLTVPPPTYVQIADLIIARDSKQDMFTRVFKRLSQNAYRLNMRDDESITRQNAMAIAIGKTLPALRHLELIGNCMSDIGLKAILDGCCHLETLDLYDESITRQNAMAIAIGKTLHVLRHLELIGNCMSDIGLKAILDGCCHLKTLDLCKFLNIHITGHMGKECVEQIKNLKLPYDSFRDCLHGPHIYKSRMKAMIMIRWPWKILSKVFENVSVD